MEFPEKLNIIHLDKDAFYVSIGERDNPGLKGWYGRKKIPGLINRKRGWTI
jgi:hypothetical protein